MQFHAKTVGKGMKMGILLLVSVLLFSSAVSAVAATKSDDPSEHPDKAVCTVCAAKSTHGTAPEAEDVAGTSTHEGKHYYFCSDDCKAEFDESPGWWVPLELPFTVPPLQVRTLEGNLVPLEVGKGKLTLLDFWATWCHPCRKTMRELQERFGQEDNELQIVGVSIDEGSDALKKVRRFTKKQGVQYPIVLDDQEPSAWSALKVYAVPTMMLVDEEGRMIWRFTGPEGDTKLAEVLAKLQP